MKAQGVALARGEGLLKEASDSHLLRAEAGALGRLCHPYLTSDRLIFCEAYYDLKAMREKAVGGVIHEVALRTITRLRPGSQAQEPCIELDVAGPGKEPERLVLFFRDDGWTTAAPERLQERDEWVAEIDRQCRRLGLALTVSQPPQAPAEAAPKKPQARAGGAVLAGKYELLRQIGSGGMGVVYEGRDLSLDRPVAVKKMRPDLKLAGRDKSAFLKEAKLSASLHHPFITDIYAILQEGDEIYLIFEFVDGKSLAEYLEAKRCMPPAQARTVLKCVCEALSYAHACKIVHRDIKPSNIMLTKHGYAKVMDFGIARQIKDTAERLSKTKLDTSGTLAYMAPEQELGRCDLRSDLFALGATVYELLSGEQPFIGPNFYLQKELKEFKPLGELEPGLPPDLLAAVDRCLSFKAADRFQTVAEFAQAIGAA